ncbi:hypothetical protein HZ994_01430 [Akkermansiaceae bacterium]|nr:hypothetical protein HZ994_01430 [Akkermansiaceae bacterium]
MSATLLSKVSHAMDHLHENEDAGRWLKAFFEKRPSSGHTEHAGEPVRYGLRASANHPSRAHKMSAWVAERLGELASKQERLPQSIREEFLAEGLFLWCAEYADESLFAKPLLGILRNREADQARGWTHDLTMAFKSALIRNQPDQELERLWLDLLDKTKPDHGFYRLWEEDFEGLLRMPGTNGEKFAWGAIGTALKTIYETILPGGPNEAKSLSPSGPMVDLYHMLADLAHLDDNELSEILWAIAAKADWGYGQMQTIPMQFFELKSGEWAIPEPVSRTLPRGNEIISYRVTKTRLLYKISAENFANLSLKARDVIINAEIRRTEYPRKMRPEVLNEFYRISAQKYYPVRAIETSVRKGHSEGKNFSEIQMELVKNLRDDYAPSTEEFAAIC